MSYGKEMHTANKYPCTSFAMNSLYSGMHQGTLVNGKIVENRLKNIELMTTSFISTKIAAIRKKIVACFPPVKWFTNAMAENVLLKKLSKH